MDISTVANLRSIRTREQKVHGTRERVPELPSAPFSGEQSAVESIAHATALATAARP